MKKSVTGSKSQPPDPLYGAKAARPKIRHQITARDTFRPEARKKKTCTATVSESTADLANNEAAPSNANFSEDGRRCAAKMRIPDQTGHPFHVKPDTDSTANWTPIPAQTGH
jgi:hypothetical protein